LAEDLLDLEALSRMRPESLLKDCLNILVRHGLLEFLESLILAAEAALLGCGATINANRIKQGTRNAFISRP
jgi:hypothetical protein